MKNKLIIIFASLLLITPFTFALSPPITWYCCQQFNEGEILIDDCAEAFEMINKEMNEENCKEIIDEFAKTQAEWLDSMEKGKSSYLLIYALLIIITIIIIYFIKRRNKNKR